MGFLQIEKWHVQWPWGKGNCVFLEQKVDQCVCVCVCADLFEFIDDDGERPQSMNLEISKEQIT